MSTVQINPKKILLKDLLGKSFKYKEFGISQSKAGIYEKELKLKKEWQSNIIKTLMKKQILDITQPISRSSLNLEKKKTNLFDTTTSNLKFPNNVPKEFKKHFFMDKKIIVFYKDKRNTNEIQNILKGPSYNLDDNTIQQIMQIKHTDSEDLKNKCLKIIKSINPRTHFNLVISIMPIFSLKPKRKAHIIVGTDFDSSRETIGLNIYSKKYFTESIDEKIEISFLALLEQVDDKLKLGLSLNSISEHLEKHKVEHTEDADITETVAQAETDDTESAEVPVLPAQTPEKTSSPSIVDFCNGEEIKDNYFSQNWDKIELEGVSSDFNTFLIEPVSSQTKSRKLLSYIDGKPTRFAGYFRVLNEEENECEIIWETEWERDFVNSDFSEEAPLIGQSLYQKKQKSSIIEDYGNNATIRWIIKLLELEDLIKAQIDIGIEGSLKIYNLPVENNNLFYSLANSFILSKIINPERNPALFIPDKLISLENNVTRPIYTDLRNQLRNLANQILKKKLKDLHDDFSQKIDSGELVDFSIYPGDEEDESVKEALNSLAKTRLSLVDLDTGDVQSAYEEKIHSQVETLLEGGIAPLSWHILQLEAISSLFKVNIKLITNSPESSIQIKHIDKTISSQKFNTGDITPDGIEIRDRDNDNDIYIIVVNRHFMSVIPYQKLENTSYNYLFQKGDLSVNVFNPIKKKKEKVSIFEFHNASSSIINNTFLEDCHNYIQWLFPNKSESYYGPGNSQKEIFIKEKPLISPKQLVLTDNDIEFIKRDDDAKLNSIKSLVRMLNFYGFRFVIENDTGIEEYIITDFQDFKVNLLNIKMDILDNSQEKDERFANLLENTHNNLRITRILEYFKNIDLVEINKIILAKLSEEINGGGLDGNQGIKNSLKKFWEKQI